MCRVGDIILIDNYKDNESLLKRHSYDLICSVLSSFKSEEQRKRKLSYPGNFPIAHDDTITNPHNNKNGFIKLDQLYYFNKEKISYKVIGSVKPDIFELLIDFLENSQFAIYDIIDKL